MLYRLLIYAIIDWILKNIPVRTGGGGQMGKSTHAMAGVEASAHLRTMGEGAKFLPFWCVCNN